MFLGFHRIWCASVHRGLRSVKRPEPAIPPPGASASGWRAGVPPASEVERNHGREETRGSIVGGGVAVAEASGAGNARSGRDGRAPAARGSSTRSSEMRPLPLGRSTNPPTPSSRIHPRRGARFGCVTRGLHRRPEPGARLARARVRVPALPMNRPSPPAPLPSDGPSPAEAAAAREGGRGWRSRGRGTAPGEGPPPGGSRTHRFVRESPSLPMTYDVLVIGGGIVGLATALRLLQSRPATRLALMEKEDPPRPPPDRQQQRRHPLRPLLQTRFPQGHQLPRPATSNSSISAATKASPTSSAEKSWSPLPRPRLPAPRRTSPTRRSQRSRRPPQPRPRRDPRDRTPLHRHPGPARAPDRHRRLRGGLGEIRRPHPRARRRDPPRPARRIAPSPREHRPRRTGDHVGRGRPSEPPGPAGS
jgi:hypothetical protein